MTDNAGLFESGGPSPAEGSSEPNMESSVNETVSNESEETSEPAEVQEKPAPEPQRIKLKSNGREKELTLEEVIKRAELADGADERFSEAARLRKQYEADTKEMLRDPAAFMLKHGVSKEQLLMLAERQVLESIEEERLTPEQRRIRDLEAELKKRDDEIKSQEQKAQEELLQKETTKQQAVLARDLAMALKKNNLPLDNPDYLAAVLPIIRNGISNDFPIAPEDAVAYAYDKMQSHFTNMLAPLSGEQIIDRLGKAVVDKIRQADLASIKGSKPEAQQPKKAVVPSEKRERPSLSAEDFFRELKA